MKAQENCDRQLSLEAFLDDLASLSVLPENSKANQMTDICGQKCYELLENLDQLGLLLKMLKTQSEWSLMRSATAWRKSATKSNRLLYRLTAPVRGSTVKEHLSWPRPTTGAPLCGGTNNFNQMHKLMEAGIISDKERRSLTQGNGGKSNPDLLEWLIGFPIGWTDLNA